MFSVLKGTSYTLVHAPDMVIHNGATQVSQRHVDPNSEYLVNIWKSLRSFEDVLSYMPNQTYIGNLTPAELEAHEMPWHDKKSEVSTREGKFGEIMPEDEFIGLMKICDAFDLVKLEESFSQSVKQKLDNHKLIEKSFLPVFDKVETIEEIERILKEEHGEGLYFQDKLVGCVKRAHDVDETLAAHVIFENLVSKASCVLSILNLIDKNDIDKSSIEYVIECSEEACGDINQRGGGNFAKAAAEIAGLTNATGSDTRGFCAAPTHALIQGSSLVRAKTFKHVIVAAGGSTAKLGMNGKDHVKKGIPILEDCVAGFAVLISEDDGISPEMRTDILGRHTVGTGSSPQNVISSLTAIPLEKAGLKLTDVDKYSVEMQNPDITKPAGAGNVPEANYKMIGALAAMRKDIEKSQLAEFVKNHGMVGWAPTQGHIPSGVPYLGFAREDILSGKINRVMVVGKGSLFLGRMTNLFDGVSFVIAKNRGKSQDSEQSSVAKTTIAVTALGSEHGEDTIYEAARQAGQKDISVIVIGSKDCNYKNVKVVKATTEEEAHKTMEKLLADGEADASVTMHYPFPIGVATVGRVVTPSKGKEMFIASTTGASSSNRTESMIKNTIYGIISAKACGIENPTVGILNVDGARQTEKALLKLKENGYDINFSASQRSDAGVVMRGNDLLSGSADVMVADSLTGNILMKMFSAYTTGGSYEGLGYGYGPGIGENFNRLVLIISRASGTPVIAGAIQYASEIVKGDLVNVASSEFAKAKKAGLDEILESVKEKKKSSQEENKASVTAPPKEVVTEEIMGIEIMDLDEAVEVLWAQGIYAESGMGCTGPMILVSEKNHKVAKEIIVKNGYIVG